MNTFWFISISNSGIKMDSLSTVSKILEWVKVTLWIEIWHQTKLIFFLLEKSTGIVFSTNTCKHLLQKSTYLSFSSIFKWKSSRALNPCARPKPPKLIRREVKLVQVWRGNLELFTAIFWEIHRAAPVFREKSNFFCSFISSRSFCRAQYCWKFSGDILGAAGPVSHQTRPTSPLNLSREVNGIL